MAVRKTAIMVALEVAVLEPLVNPLLEQRRLALVVTAYLLFCLAFQHFMLAVVEVAVGQALAALVLVELVGKAAVEMAEQLAAPQQDKMEPQILVAELVALLVAAMLTAAQAALALSLSGISHPRNLSLSLTLLPSGLLLSA
jgi:hypothetical protein